jgi:hypothetical protein
MSKKISYTIDIDGNLGNLESKLSNMKGMFAKLTEGGNHSEITQIFTNIEKSIDKLRSKAS